MFGGDFQVPSVGQYGIPLPGKSGFIEIFNKSCCEISGDFYYTNDLDSLIKITIFLDKRSILLPICPCH